MFDGRIESRFKVPAGVTLLATSAAGGPTSVPMLQGNFFLTSIGATQGLLAMIAAQLNAVLASGWTLTLSTGINGTGKVTLSATGTWSLAWTSTELRDLLGFTGDFTGVSTPQTGTNQARGLWRPDAPFALDMDPRSAPPDSDRRTTSSPRGKVLGYVGNKQFRHSNALWTGVIETQVWEGLATIPKSSLEYFFNETQMGFGSSWFTVASPVQIYTDGGVLVGQLANSGAGVTGWGITGVRGVASMCSLTQPPWTHLYNVKLPELLAEGA